MANDFSVNGSMTLDTSGFEASISQAEDIIVKMRAELENFKSSLGSVEETVDNTGSAVHDDSNDIENSLSSMTSKINDGLKDWGINLNKFVDKGSSLLKSWGLDIDKLASKFGMSAPLMAGIVACTAALAKLGAEMDEARVEIVNGTGAIGDALSDLENSAHKALVLGVGASVKETGKLIADINTRFGLMGDSLEDLTVDFGHFAKITGVDLNNAVNDVADVMKRWNVSTDKSKVLMNQLAKASQMSGASVNELMSAVKSGQTYLSQFGYNLTESVALLSNFKQNGIQTSTVLTGMRTALVKFSSEGKNAKEAFAEVVDSIQNAETETEALSIATETFGTRAGPEMFQAIRSGSVDIASFTNELENAGETLENTYEATRTSKDAMNDLKNSLKGTFGGLGQGITAVFKGIIDAVTEVVRFIEPVVTPVVNVIKTLLTEIGNLISWLVKSIRTTIEQNRIAWQAFVKILNDVGKAVEKNLKDIFGIFKNIFGVIFSILGGQWEKAWINFKLILFKACRIIATVCNTIANLFIDLSNKIAEKFFSKFGDLWKDWYKKAIDLAHKTGNVLDFTGLGKLTEGMNEAQIDAVLDKMIAMGKSGEFIQKKVALEEEKIGNTGKSLNDFINDAEKRLKELEGASDSAIGSIGNVSFGGALIGEIEQTEDGLDKVASESDAWLQKRLQQQLDNITKEKESYLQAMREEGASQEELDKINEVFAKKQIELYEQIQSKKKEADLNSIKNLKNYEDEKLSLEEYYADEAEKYRLQVTTNTVKEIEKAVAEQEDNRYKIISEWTDKLDKQKQDSLAYEEKMLKELAETEQDKEIIAYDYAKKRHELEMERLQKERQSMIEQAGGVDEAIEKINQYYDLQEAMAVGNFNLETMRHNKAMENIQSEGDASEKVDDARKERVEKLVQTIGKIKNIISTTTKTVSKVMSTATSIVKKGVKGIKNIFLKLIDFDNNDLLDSLLKWEDKVLTFFTEGASQIPAFIASALQSIRVLTDNIFSSLTEGGMGSALGDIVKSIVSEVPVIIENVTKILAMVFKEIISGLKDNLPSLIKTVVSVIKDLINELPTILPMLIEGVVMLIEGVMDALEELFDDDDAMEKLTDAVAGIIQKVFESAVKNIPKALKLFVQAIKTLVVAIVKAVVSIVKDTDWGAVWNEFKRIGGEFLGGIWEGITNGASWLWGKIKEFFSSIWEWISGFFSDLWQKIKDAVQGIIDGIKNAFNSVGNFFSDVGSGIKNFFGNIGSGIKSFFGFANGTDNAPAGLAMVGEEGPELVRFHGGEQVIDARNTQRMLSNGAGGSVFNVTFNNTQDTTAFAMMKQMKGWQKSLAFNAVI